MIWPRSAILHKAAASIVEGTFGLTVSIADRIATRTSAKPQRLRQIDRVLHDIDLAGEVGGDVDGGVGDDQRVLVAGHIHHEAMADAARRADAGLARDDRAHQLVGMKAALHQGFGLALAHEFDGLVGGVVAVRGGHEGECRDVQIRLGGRGADALGRPDQDRRDQAEPGRFHRAFERDPVAGVGDGGRHRRQLARRRQQTLVARAADELGSSPSPRSSSRRLFHLRRARLRGRRIAEQRLDALQPPARPPRLGAPRASMTRRSNPSAVSRCPPVRRQQLRQRRDRALLVEAQDQELVADDLLEPAQAHALGRRQLAGDLPGARQSRARRPRRPAS